MLVHQDARRNEHVDNRSRFDDITVTDLRSLVCERNHLKRAGRLSPDRSRVWRAASHVLAV